MVSLVIVAALILGQRYTPIQAAPSTEACPSDSILNEGECICDPESCVLPPCLSRLNIAVNATDEPGSCCPIYECVDCKNDTLIDGKCPCAPEAVLNSRNQCQCVDEEKHLVDGECVCNPLQCPIPPLCDRKSVAVTDDDGCCRKIICKPCPSDSESTHLESEDLEDHCVCLPCHKECGPNRTAVVKKQGSGLPGNCCDLYECKLLDEFKVCRDGNMVYQNGQEWQRTDNQKCKCQNSVSKCFEEKSLLSCMEDHKIYQHNETWTKDGGCTNCTCINGEHKCISHFCEVKESHIQKNETLSCFRDNVVYQDLETWIETDGCTQCTCRKGEEDCTQEFCEKEPMHTTNECKPLANCNRTCINGFRINKKGCEICKCNSFKLTQGILSKYNLTMEDLISIVEDYVNQRTSTSTTSTTTTAAPPPVERVSTISPENTNQNAKIFKEILVPSTTREPSMVPTDESVCWNIAIPVSALIIFVCLVLLIVMIVYVRVYIVNSRRKYSMELDRYYYNNTIKKTQPLLKSDCDK